MRRILKAKETPQGQYKDFRDIEEGLTAPTCDSREDTVLNELEKIAFGDGPVAGKLKAMELLSKHVCFLHLNTKVLLRGRQMTFSQKSKIGLT